MVLDTAGLRLAGVVSFVGAASLLAEADVECLVGEDGELRSSLVLFFLRKPREGIRKLVNPSRDDERQKTRNRESERDTRQAPHKAGFAASNKARKASYTNNACRQELSKTTTKMVRLANESLEYLLQRGSSADTETLATSGDSC